MDAQGTCKCGNITRQNKVLRLLNKTWSVGSTLQLPNKPKQWNSSVDELQSVKLYGHGIFRLFLNIF